MNAIFGAPSEKLAGPGGVANNARQVARAHSRRIVFDRNRDPAEREKGLQHVANAAGNAGRDIQNEARFEVIGALNGQRVGARNVAHIEKVAFGFKIADAQHRKNNPFAFLARGTLSQAAPVSSV